MTNIAMRTFLLALSLFLAGASTSQAATIYGPSAYLSFADSPFFGGSYNYFHLENFESGALAVPGVTPSSGSVLGPGLLTDSVDADDGSIDGSGTAGHSFYVAATNVTFSFNALALGSLPTHAGLVFTDVGFTIDNGLGTADLYFEAFGPGNVSLGSVGLVAVGDGAAGGLTAEDRFFGVVDLGGIQKISVTINSADWEMDHLQYGLQSENIPEPASAWLLALGLAPFAVRMARRRRRN